MTEIQIVRGDKNFPLHFTIYDADNKPVDLTGVDSIVLKYKNYENGEVVNIPGTVQNPTEGSVVFQVTDQFVDIVGEFKAEIEITYSNGCVLTAPNIVIKVIPDIR